MNENPTWTKRRFLQALVSLGAITLAQPVWALLPSPARRPPDPLAVRLAGFFIHKESAVRVGRAYLRSFPGEADAQRLVSRLCASDPLKHRTLLDADSKRCFELLALTHRQDFEKGRIVKVDGWILSETEARLCALATLLV